MISNFGSAEAQSDVINILFLPLIWAFFHIIKAIFSTPLGALSDRIGRKTVINIGWGIYVFVYFSFAFLVFLPARLQIGATFILFAIYALFYAFTEGAEKALVADMVKEEKRGTAFGLYNFAVRARSFTGKCDFRIPLQLFRFEIPGVMEELSRSVLVLYWRLISMIMLSAMVKESSKQSNVDQAHYSSEGNRRLRLID